MLFDKVKPEHILFGIRDFEEKGLPKGFGPSTSYDLLFKGKKYPPKAVMAYANFYASGRKVERYFKGGDDTECFQVLRDNGFIVEEKTKIETKINTKLEFSSWLLKNAPDSYNQYLGGSTQSVIERLNEIQEFFPELDFFNVNETNYSSLINQILFSLKKKERLKKPKFIEYDQFHSNGIPKAVVGKNNYVKFLEEKFNTKNNSKSSNLFTWVQTHKELAQYLLTKENNQLELIDLLKSASVSGFKDGEENGKEIELKEMDPFTFFFFIYKYGPDRRLSILQNIAKKLHLTIPTDDTGIPSVQPLKVCLFPFKEFRNNNEIARLWAFFRKTLNNTISEEEFSDILTINSTGKTKLSEGMFDVYPDAFFPINGPTKPYLKEIFGIDPNFNTYSEYQEILESIRQITSKPFYEISYDAWKWNNTRDKTNYWIFQGNPTIYNITNALKAGHLKSWKITAHKSNIKIDDKVIIWQTGEDAGCYALAEVTSKVDKFEEEDFELLYYKLPQNSKSSERVKLKITNYFADSPILWKDLKNMPEFTNFKAGNQGTNFRATQEEFEAILNFKKNTNTMEKESNLVLNKILFGPPGTGKTYHTINEAIKIADPDFYELNKNNRDKLKERFKLLLLNSDNEGNGQIAFTTFHQSFSYEDFVEGIKPTEPKEGDEYLKYEIQEGVFKKICRMASDSLKAVDVNSDTLISISEEEFNQSNFYKMSLGNSQQDDDQDIFDYCAQNNCISIGFGNNLDFSGLDEKDLKTFGKDNNLEAFPIQAMNLFKNYLKNGNFVVISHGNNYVRAIGRVIGDYEYRDESPFPNNPTFNHFRKVEWIFNDKEIASKDIYHKNLSQQTIYKLLKTEIKKEFFVKEKKIDTLRLPKNPKNYVIVIDEINRGNVSSIFGELITLIEKDKRAGGDEELSVILPYSKKEFKVPQNVFIIGTMNTADRSIEALDTALRRRFSFKEMPPKASLILNDSKLQNGKIGTIDVVEILETINNRIEKLIDKDHKIGHSYFLAIETKEDLINVFENEIIPLLEEYFFGDLGKIGLILGNSFITKNNKSEMKFAKFDEYDPSIVNDLLERNVFEITPQENWNFESIYEIN
ncbi:EVE domain-containing protein [Lutibacter citreus]|uniref:EVE domain-containing protein n=1 Tax=Lutibacter citreus TaxID=2138210 RepID=UPI000DBE3A56|nr:EVE domain-containing protein [Lutibacter citreus]